MYPLAVIFLSILALVSSVVAIPAFDRRDSPSQTILDLLSTPFPALTDDSKIAPVQQLAHGTLPNGGFPPAGSISPDGITNLQLIALNEFFEAAFFTSLLHNITNNVPGFGIDDQGEKTFVIDSLIAITAVSFHVPSSFNMLNKSTARAAPRHIC
jgi:hypothetical protein